MKTNQILTRSMGSFEVNQRTKDGMFNATSLLNQWNESAGMKKEVADFFKNDNSKEFLKILKEDLNTGDSPYLSSRGRYGGTWMHPYLFIKFAMWLNPRFELSVIKFVYDHLVKFRHEIGDKHLPVMGVIKSNFKKVDFAKVNKALNYVVFNAHFAGIRNTGTEEQINDFSKLQDKVITLIEVKHLETQEMLLEFLRDEWRKRFATLKF